MTRTVEQTAQEAAALLAFIIEALESLESAECPVTRRMLGLAAKALARKLDKRI